MDGNAGKFNSMGNSQVLGSNFDSETHDS
uniref:Uncharacterized protein n=1 Tax=mine drainage metagenome TaxID=410659 RepID=E6QSI2_9ZZZZ